MEAAIEFLRENWKFLVEILVPILSMLILLIFKKRAKINIPDATLSGMFAALPLWIQDAETTIGAGKGDQKLKFVLTQAVNYLAKALGVSTGEILRCYGSQLLIDIENILATPQKKGDQ